MIIDFDNFPVLFFRSVGKITNMKLLSITLVTFLVCMQQSEGRYQVIRMGGYLWVSVDGRPYVRLSPNLFGNQFLRPEIDENLDDNGVDIDEPEAMMNNPNWSTNSGNGEESSMMKRNPAWNYVPRKKDLQKRLNYVRLAKKSYVRLAKRPQD